MRGAVWKGRGAGGEGAGGELHVLGAERKGNWSGPEWYEN